MIVPLWPVQRGRDARETRGQDARATEKTTAGGPGLFLSLSRIVDPDCRVEPFADNAEFGFVGSFVEGVSFCVLARVATNGELRGVPDGLAVEGATDTRLALTIADGGRCRPLPHEGRENLHGMFRTRKRVIFREEEERTLDVTNN